MFSDFGNIFKKTPSADGGGYTGMGARAGGVDGKGGFPAILHPNETVIDHTKGQGMGATDRKSTRLNSSHGYISYAVFCLKKKKKRKKRRRKEKKKEKTTR